MKFSTHMAAGLFAGALILGAGPLAVAGGLQPRGSEFALTRGMLGDQVNPTLSLGSAVGILLWQDAAVDGQGLGIAAARVSSAGENLATGTVRVNEVIEGDQENPSVVKLPDGGWFALWQSGKQGFQNIAGRLLDGGGQPSGRELLLSTGNGVDKVEPTAAVLADGSIVVAWSASRQDGGQGNDLYARILSPDAKVVGAEFRVASGNVMGRRSASICSRPDGGFMLAWVSESQVGIRNNVDPTGRPQNGGGAPRFEVAVTVRSFGSDGVPVAPEQTISGPGALAANPSLTCLPNANVLVAWTRRHPTSLAARYDIYSRVVDSSGVPLNNEVRVNDKEAGDQYRARIASTPHGVLAVWSSNGQDGSWEGVFGRWISADGTPQGDDFSVNSQVGGGQILPAVASDQEGGLTVVWASNMPRSGYELFAQRFAPLKLRVRPQTSGKLRMDWSTIPGSGYQLQYSRDGASWSNVDGPRTASSDSDSVELAAAGRVVLYRVVRVR